MKLEEIRTLAKSHGIHTAKLSKAELVRSIQADEGNLECYGTNTLGDCDQNQCLWRKDCFATSGQGALS